MKIKNLFIALLAVAMAMPAAAQFEAGKLYRFVNKAYTNLALASASYSEVYGTEKADNEYSQIWQVAAHPTNSSAWTFRNLGNGLYLEPKGTSTIWTFKPSANEAAPLYSLNIDGAYTLSPNTSASGFDKMHCASTRGYAVVGWEASASASQWTVEQVNVSDEDLQKNWEALDAFNNVLTEEFRLACTQNLNNLFKDGACTELAKTYADEAALEADEDYKALPATLQNMVKKVYTGNWTEDNFKAGKKAWDTEYAKRFRVQQIEPYSIAGEVTEKIFINAHKNMDNPTGIFANARQHLYVIVEGEIKAGAELWLNTIIGHGMVGSHTDGIQLQEGLNVIPFSGDGNSIFLNYVVHTYQNNVLTNKLSNYSPLKVHIEGGNINGFYNAMGDAVWGEPDNDDDWLYYEERATLPSATLLGRYQILHFRFESEFTEQLEDDNGPYTYRANGLSYYLPEGLSVPAGTPDKQKINTMLEAWDRIHMSELATMGLLSKHAIDSVNALYPRYNEKWEKDGNIYDYTDAMYEQQGGYDYSEYFNHHGIAYGNYTGYMSGGWPNCNYNHNTMGDIIGYMATKTGAEWGPAHEIGHQHQRPLTVNGLTEVTNNLFSNIAVWYMGRGTSRVNGSEGSLTRLNQSYKDGDNFLFFHHSNGAQNLWTQTQMYYKLWLYYHRCGYKTDFYPTLFQLLRDDRLSSNALGWWETIYPTEGNPYTPGYTNGKSSILKFYRHACKAAQEDLTEFFRAHGFFVLMDDMERGDYSASVYKQTQEEVDEAINWVKSQGWPENIRPLFINDCVAEPTYGHDAKTVRNYWDPNETSSGENAHVGLYTSFINPTKQVEGYYYMLSSTGALTIKQKENAAGAVGFLVYGNGELLAFADRFINISLSKKALDMSIEVYALQGDGTKVKLPTAAEAGSEEEILAMLKEEIEFVDNNIPITDDRTFVGYYTTDKAAALIEAYNAAKDAVNNAEKDKYVDCLFKLQEERLLLVEDEYAYIRIKEGNTYTIANFNNSGRLLTDNATKLIGSASDATVTNDMVWSFVPSKSDASKYSIVSKNNMYIIAAEAGGQQARTNVLQGLGAAVDMERVREYSPFTGDAEACYNIGVGDGYYLRMKKVGTEYNVYTAEAQKWFIRVHEDNTLAAETKQFASLMGEADDMINKVVASYTDEDITFNEGIVPLVEELDLINSVRALIKAKEAAEANKDVAVDIYLYILELQDRMDTLNTKYVAMPELPKASTDEAPVWYYIKSVEESLNGNNAYCYNAGYEMQFAQLNKYDTKQWWAFYQGAKEDEFYIRNAYDDAYANEGIFGTVEMGGKSWATPFIFTLVPAKYGFTINYNQYWQAASYGVALGGSFAATHFTIEQVPEAVITGIETVIDEAVVEEGIYDLTGRRIKEITAPGIYIINGVKKFVK